MSLAVQSATTAFYTAMNHNAAYSAMRTNMARMNLISADNVNFGMLAKADKCLACQSLNDRLMYKISEVLLENQKALKNKRAKLNTFA